MNGTIFKCIIVFFAAGLGDVLWAKYGMNLAAKRSIRSSNWGSMIHATSAISAYIYVRSLWFIPFAVVGGWIGNFMSVEHQKHIEARGPRTCCHWWNFHKWVVVKKHPVNCLGNLWADCKCSWCGKEDVRKIGTSYTGPK